MKGGNSPYRSAIDEEDFAVILYTLLETAPSLPFGLRVGMDEDRRGLTVEPVDDPDLSISIRVEAWRTETNLGFEDWLSEVDDALNELAGGIYHDDLADQLWRDWYDEGEQPFDAAVRALENEGFEIEFEKPEDR